MPGRDEGFSDYFLNSRSLSGIASGGVGEGGGGGQISVTKDLKSAPKVPFKKIFSNF